MNDFLPIADLLVAPAANLLLDGVPDLGAFIDESGRVDTKIEDVGKTLSDSGKIEDIATFSVETDVESEPSFENKMRLISIKRAEGDKVIGVKVEDSGVVETESKVKFNPEFENDMALIELIIGEEEEVSNLIPIHCS